MYVDHFFSLNENAVDIIHDMEPEFGYDGFGEFLFYRTYSREKMDDTNENWADCVIRNINGTFSIRKDWYIRNRIPWDEAYWQKYALEMAISMFRMEWSPPGRGLWMMGTNFMYERGSMALYNCAFTYLTSDNFAEDIEWLMDCLMLGVGVGFEPTTDPMPVYEPRGYYHNIIDDSREGWANSTKLLIQAYTIPGARKPINNYSQLRRKNEKIKGFGGKASGPEPLIQHHNFIEECFKRHIHNPTEYPIFRLKADIANHNGCCVVAGNVRRSAELMKGDVTNTLLLDLKDYDLYPDRESYAWMSNNTANFYEDHHYEMLGEVARRVIVRGEPGVANLRNFPVGRVGKKDRGRIDLARGLNPCGEITLEHRETCNVVETFPTACANVERWYKACEYATTYASTVSLLPTHQPSTNRVVARNRRIGVSIVDYTGWRIKESQYRVIRYMRKGYKIVCETNRLLNSEAGVPEAIKKTTIKPGGTVPKLKGKTPGIGYPTFDYTLRGVIVDNSHPVYDLLIEAGVPHEPQKFEPETSTFFKWPIHQGPAKPATKASLWEQAINLMTVQHEWADNAVSNTLYFRPKWKLIKDVEVRDWKGCPTHLIVTADDLYQTLKQCTYFEFTDVQNIWSNKIKEHETDEHKVFIRWKNGKATRLMLFEFDPNHEENDIEPVLSSTVPHIKSLALSPHLNASVYEQPPEQGISEEEYRRLKANLKPIDWTRLTSSEAEGDKYCSGPTCELPLGQRRQQDE
jgi:ribonucleoside-triphosphate reductase (thioredoxin)